MCFSLFVCFINYNVFTEEKSFYIVIFLLINWFIFGVIVRNLLKNQEHKQQEMRFYVFLSLLDSLIQLHKTDGK